jgi:hypothetical protein
MQWVLLGVGLFVATGFLLRWIANANPSDIRRTGLWLGAIFLLLLCGWLLLSGRMAAVVAAIFAALPFVYRFLKIGLLWPFLRRMFNANRYQGQQQTGSGKGRHSSGGSGRVSEIKTQFLHMYLDHDSGRLQGTVIAGKFAGRDLDALGVDDLQDFFVQCCGAQDQSQAVLETYLDRRPDCENWRNWYQGGHAGDGGSGNEHDGGRGGFRKGEMDVEEARKILGVGKNASRAEINRAYQTLIKAVHPDHGGSDYLASRINAARTLLLQLCKD